MGTCRGSRRVRTQLLSGPGRHGNEVVRLPASVRQGSPLRPNVLFAQTHADPRQLDISAHQEISWIELLGDSADERAVLRATGRSCIPVGTEFWWRPQLPFSQQSIPAPGFGGNR
jgi:hypothetical protein